MEVNYSRLSIYRSSSTYAKRKLDPLPAAAFQIMLSLADRDLTDTPLCGRWKSRPVDASALGLEHVQFDPGAPRGKADRGGYRSKEPEDWQERRRYYRLTAAGRKLARSEAEKMADVLRVARSRKILRGDYV